MMSYFRANINSKNSSKCEKVVASAQLGHEGSMRYTLLIRHVIGEDTAEIRFLTSQ